MGLGGPFDSLFNALGLRDPIAHYEPELQNNLGRVYGKYEDLVGRYTKEVGGLRSNSVRRELADEIGRMARLVEEIRPVFEGLVEGAVVGERDRDKLAELVQGVRDWQGDWRDAKKKYGWSPVAEEEPSATPAPKPTFGVTPQAPAAAASPGIPWGLIAAGAVGGALAVVVAVKASRRGSAKRS